MLPWPIYAHLLSFIMMLVRTQGSWRRLLLIAVRTQHALTGKKISFASMSNIFYSKDNQLKIGVIFIREAIKKRVFYGQADRCSLVLTLLKMIYALLSKNVSSRI